MLWDFSRRNQTRIPASCLVVWWASETGCVPQPGSQLAQVHHQLFCPGSVMLPPCPRVSPASSSTIQPDWLSPASHSVPRGTSRKGELRLTRCFWIKMLPGAAQLGVNAVAAVSKQLFLAKPTVSQRGQESITHWRGSCLSLLLCSIQWFWSLSGLLTSASSPKQEIQQLSSPAQKLSF